MIEIIPQISTESPLWEKTLDTLNEKYIIKVMEICLANFNVNKDIKEIEISILLTDNKNIQILNLKYLNKNSATNVLSFPSEEIIDNSLENFPHYKGEAILGDIALAYETCLSEAEQENIPFMNKISHLLVHSILHLIGYDHQNDDEAKIMEDMEDLILAKLDIIVNREANV